MKTFLSVIISLLLLNVAKAKIIHVPGDQPTIKAGIATAIEGDTVLVQPGKYVEHISFNGKGIVVGSLFLTTRDTSYISQTVIDGDTSGKVVFFISNEVKTSILCGFTIQNGLGGVFCFKSSPTITYCTISSNSTIDTLENGKGAGGGIYCEHASPTISYCTIYGNTAYGYFAWGGGIYCCLSSKPEITHCIISNNSSVPYYFATLGGGIYSRESSPRILNSLITNNKSSMGAGMYCYWYDNTEVINCTVTENINSIHSSTVSIDGHSSIKIANSIIYGNTGNSDVAVNDVFSSIKCYTSDIGTGYSGGTNISSNPLFIGSSDYRLQAASPCIDAGNSLWVGWDSDLNGNQRLWDGNGSGVAYVDMGAYEYGSQSVSPLYLTHNTGDFKMSIFWDGSIGHLSSMTALGEGCEFKNNSDALYAGGLIFGTKSAGYVNGNQASLGIVNDFINIESIHTVTSMDPEIDYISETAYNDNNAAAPYGVSVSQEALSKSGDEFVILKFGFTPTSSSLKYFYAGIFADWDVGAADGYSKNLGGYDQSRNLAYQYINDRSPDPNYYGIVALSGMAGAKIAADTGGVTMRETALQRISTFENDTITEIGDYRMWIGSGPFTLKQGNTKFVYFAFVAGTDLANLQANADAAAQKYQHIITDVGENEVLPTQFGLSQNYPDPFNPTTLINYQIPKGSNVILEIFDVLGRRVKVLVDEYKNAGNYKIEFNAKSLSSGTYFYRIRTGKFSAVKKMLLIK